jgi:hypothetical protein
MKVYTKLIAARNILAGKTLRKSGFNKFAGYQYFELGDFLPEIQAIFAQVGLVDVITFTSDIATMTLYDCEDGSSVVFTSPMGSAQLKGCHEVQCIGAVETYQRRYLYVTSMAIVEHDALDATTGKKGDGPVVKPTQTDPLPDDRMSVVLDVKEAIIDRMSQDDLIGAYEEYLGITDSEEKTVLWGMLDSKIRSAIKKHGESLKG